ncbi:MAG: hypothetical protein QXY87_05805 [Saccharolobus sp.]|uniref:Uncharacterized protein n=1 Tax=Saccharolobus shibatae (strain ATCC 51178 / DSM 5389 / JCM 8931 / NBRC 15437 / B12) TaxID=523848 RepID=A0A8F5GSZ4_SACSH|nr:hypothetical protein [Saccharolobus shibatae]MCH4815211.1 hypothetical protein [Saccharolobus shibatae]QXJ28409.1 Uncharacterized protein J5U23_01278 [Saccharolobus shibatae B12]
MIEWKGFGKRWGKCEECWLAYERGIQHEHSLNCYKLGIPIDALKVPLDQFLNITKDLSGKYAIFGFPLNLLSRGVIIFYFNTKEEMENFIESIRNYIKDEISFREKKFYDTFVNVEWIGGMNWRRGCPEYDRKFGDWRKWMNYHKQDW